MKLGFVYILKDERGMFYVGEHLEHVSSNESTLFWTYSNNQKYAESKIGTFPRIRYA